MKANDARKLDHKTLEEIRIRAVRRVVAGENPEAVIKVLGFHRSRIYQWLAAYREGGEEALKAKELEGRPSKLSEKQAQKLFDIIAQDTPLQHRFTFALWTLALISVRWESRQATSVGVTLPMISGFGRSKSAGDHARTRVQEMDCSAICLVTDSRRSVRESRLIQ